jgi:teichuronic acid biosynthesis glycosyltransferase TuaC
LNNNVKFLGNINEDLLVQYYNTADIFCLPSSNEGLPNVIVESLLCGTPVVASSVGGIPEIIKDGVNGFLIDPKNPESIVQALKYCMHKDWNREKLRDTISFLTSDEVIK